MNIPHILNNNRGLCPTTAQQKVDVHIIQPAVWDDRAIKLHAQCVDSLKNEPVDIHFVDYVPGDIRAARFAGFSRGIHKYVSFVDWDDYIEPGIFSKCLTVLNQGEACGAFTRSYRVTTRKNGMEVKSPMRPYRAWPLSPDGYLTDIHQLVVMNRDDCLRVYQSQYNEIPPIVHEMTWVYWEMARCKPWISMPDFGYNWRVHPMGAHTITSPQITADFNRSITHMRTIRKQFQT